MEIVLKLTSEECEEVLESLRRSIDYYWENDMEESSWFSRHLYGRLLSEVMGEVPKHKEVCSDCEES